MTHAADVSLARAERIRKGHPVLYAESARDRIKWACRCLLIGAKRRLTFALTFGRLGDWR